LRTSAKTVTLNDAGALFIVGLSIAKNTPYKSKKKPVLDANNVLLSPFSILMKPKRMATANTAKPAAKNSARAIRKNGNDSEDDAP